METVWDKKEGDKYVPTFPLNNLNVKVHSVKFAALFYDKSK